MINELNDENRLDVNWYILGNPDLNLIHENARSHWETEGSLTNRSPNLIHKMHHPNTISIDKRDGMLEHTYERIFGILCSVTNFTILSLSPRNYLSEYKIRIIPIVFPQYHQIPENDQFWGEGFTEWTLLRKMPNEVSGELIKFPHPDIGYYDFLELKHRKQ